MRFQIEILGPQHDRGTFHSGSEPLDRYFREQVSQDVRRRTTGCYVAIENDTGKIAGYYTIAAAGILLTDLSPDLQKRLPRYPSVPAARMGRLAVDQSFRGQRLGAALLWDAATRAARSEVVVFALVVDARDDSAIAFYRHLGLTDYGSAPNRLILPLAKFKPVASAS